MNNLAYDDIEQVFFNYYEGMLREDEKEALFTFLDENPALYQDFLLWKDTYVNEPLPVLDQLEKKLLRYENVPYISGKSFLYKLLILTGAGAIMWWWIADTDLNNKQHVTPNQVKKEHAPAVLSPVIKNNEGKAKYSDGIQNKPRPPVNIIGIEQPSTLFNDSTSSNIVVINGDDSVGTQSVFDSTRTEQTEIPKQQEIETRNSEPQFSGPSKKELKQIERTKARAKRLRQEQEFLKGNQPYVVPIDPNRF